MNLLSLLQSAPRNDPYHPLPKSGEERIVYRLAALTRMVEPPR